MALLYGILTKVLCHGELRREGLILAVNEFNVGVMYLVSLADFLAGSWFYHDIDSLDGTFVETRNTSIELYRGQG